MENALYSGVPLFMSRLFRYHIHGANFAFLTIKRREFSVDNMIWTAGRDQANEWHVAEIDIKTALEHNIVFSAWQQQGDGP